MKKQIEKKGVTQRTLARRLKMHPSRATHLMGLLNLSPVIQYQIASLPPCRGRGPITERVLRPIAKIEDPARQLQQFQNLMSDLEPEIMEASNVTS